VAQLATVGSVTVAAAKGRGEDGRFVEDRAAGAAIRSRRCSARTVGKTSADRIGAKYDSDLRDFDSPEDSRVLLVIRPRRVNVIDVRG
jgi:transposase